MEQFTKQMKFILAFLVMVLLISMFTNSKMTYTFLVLVLLSMVIINSEKIKELLGGL